MIETRHISAGLLAAFFVLVGLSAADAQVDLIVTMDDGAPAEVMSQLESAPAKQADLPGPLFAGVEEIRNLFPAGSDLRKHGAVPPPQAFRLTVVDSATFYRLSDLWANQPGVRYVQPNYQYRLDALIPVQAAASDSVSHLDVIRARQAWQITKGHPSVRIGFVDTGVYLNHPSLRDRIWVNPEEDVTGNGCLDPNNYDGTDRDGNGFIDDVCGYNFVDRIVVEPGNYRGRGPDPSDDPSPGAGRGHGTIIAGLIAAAESSDPAHAMGVAPGARIVPLRAFGADGIGEDADISAAIVYAAQMGLEVLNLSFGDAVYSQLMHEAIQYAVARGTTVIASAGNVGGDHPHYPSDFPEVISAVWLDSEGRSVAGRASHGVGVDLGAPGTAVYSTLLPPTGALGNPSANQLFGRRSGSSISSALVSGAAALLKSINPDLTPEAIRSILTSTAVDIGATGWDHRAGAGRIDVLAAVQNAFPGRVEITWPEHQGGVRPGLVEIRGSAVSPLFQSFSVMFAAGNENPDDRWTPISGPTFEQLKDGVLAEWDTGSLAEGPHLLRLVVELRDGRTVEDRRRVYVQHGAPALRLIALAPILAGGRNGILAEFETPDLTDGVLEIRKGTTTSQIPSGRLVRRHGAIWVNETGDEVTLEARVVATNQAGFRAETAWKSIYLPAIRLNNHLFEEQVLDVPHGYLLPFATDFDGDGLKEIVLNIYQDGWLGDTLAVYEWGGDGFRRAHDMIASVFPRDVGDSRGNGRSELLGQVSGAMLLLEQSAPDGFPDQIVHVDTTGLSNPTADRSTFAARMYDFDGDGRDEILVHNTRAWRVLKFNGGEYVEIARLENPTGAADSEVGENIFQEPRVLIADFNRSGHANILAGDADGDLIMYEARPGNQFDVIWTHETSRYNAGSRFAKGNFLGNGRVQFWTYTSSWEGLRSDREYEAQYGVYYLWDHAAADEFRIVDSVYVAGEVSRHGTLSAGDFTGDGLDDLVLIHPPHLYLLTQAAEWQPVFHRGAFRNGAPAGMRSVEAVVADFEGSGTPQLIAAEMDGRLRMFSRSGVVPQFAAPHFVSAYPVDETAAFLEWRAAGADSVSVFAGIPGEALDEIHTGSDSTAVIARAAEEMQFALKAWYGSVASPLSETAALRFEPAAVVSAVDFPADGYVRLRFTRRIAERVRASMFRLEPDVQPSAAILEANGFAVVLRFEAWKAGPQTLFWSGLKDEWGAPVASPGLEIDFSPQPDRSLILASWEIMDRETVRLTFNKPLDGTFAAAAGNYRVEPAGTVLGVDFSPENPTDVVVSVSGAAFGATGLSTRLVVVDMRGADGSFLGAEGNVALLSEPAAGLTDAYVFPNPYRQAEHPPRVMIAGLPAEAAVQIMSLNGVRVRDLEITGGRGGIEWDLNDDDGSAVPSGIYLVRIESPGTRPVIIKTAVIR